MHESSNRPTRGISDCPGCARHGHPPGRTRAHSYSRRSLAGEKPHAVCVGLCSRRASAVTVARSVAAPLATGMAAHGVVTMAEGAARCAALPLLRLDARLSSSKCGRRSGGPGEGLGGSGGSGVVDLADLRPRITPAYYPPYLGNVLVGASAFKADPPSIGPPRHVALAASFSFACGECENDHCFFLRKHAGADVQPTRLGSIECWEGAQFLSPRLQQVKGHLSPSALLLRDLDVTGCK
jgi:hypothetical protein